MKPKVTVLLPVFNAQNYLKEAINSILTQSFTDYELLILNDGSTDSSLEIMQKYDDKRIQIINSSKNVGLIETLNYGIECANGEYIARMDADDLSEPNRLVQQVNFMDKNPIISASSSWIKFFGQRKGSVKLPTDSDELYLKTLLHVPLAHAAAIVRKDFLNKFQIRYSKEFIYSEDSQFWVKVQEFGKVANLPIILYQYRQYETQVTKIHREQMTKSSQLARNIHFSNILQKFGILNDFVNYKLFLPDEFAENHRGISEEIFIKLMEINNKECFFKNKILHGVLLKLWWDMTKKHTNKISQIVNNPLWARVSAQPFYKLRILASLVKRNLISL